MIGLIVTHIAPSGQKIVDFKQFQSHQMPLTLLRGAITRAQKLSDDQYVLEAGFNNDGVTESIKHNVELSQLFQVNIVKNVGEMSNRQIIMALFEWTMVAIPYQIRFDDSASADEKRHNSGVVMIDLFGADLDKLNSLSVKASVEAGLDSSDPHLFHFCERPEIFSPMYVLCDRFVPSAIMGHPIDFKELLERLSEYDESDSIGLIALLNEQKRAIY